MGDASSPPSNISWWISAAQTLGISTVIAGVMLWWANGTVEFERKSMLPAIEGNKAVVERNSQALKDNTDVMQAVKTSIDGLSRSEKHRAE